MSCTKRRKRWPSQFSGCYQVREESRYGDVSNCNSETASVRIAEAIGHCSLRIASLRQNRAILLCITILHQPSRNADGDLERLAELTANERRCTRIRLHVLRVHLRPFAVSKDHGLINSSLWPRGRPTKTERSLPAQMPLPRLLALVFPFLPSHDVSRPQTGYSKRPA
jgi:hypothetical protein